MKITDLFGGGVPDVTNFPSPTLDVSPGPDTPPTAVLAGGCFWCTEAVFLPLDGVSAVVSGYIGGAADTATYEAVCSGSTGHAEAIRITFAPEVISYGQLLRVFFAVAHDPTQLNRQGNDRGTQYRSAIFPVDAEQRAVAEAYIAQLDAAGVLGAPIATTVEPEAPFYAAEDYHQNYAARNPHQPYVAAVAAPKVEKLHKYLRRPAEDLAAPLAAAVEPVDVAAPPLVAAARTAGRRLRHLQQETPAVTQTFRAATFLVKAPFILAFLFVINLLTSPGHWWVQWAALGLGIAWLVSLMRVLRAVVLAGGLAAVAAVLLRHRRGDDGGDSRAI